jgi:hypothetical protein
MAGLEQAQAILHKIKVRLFPNTLPTVKEPYIARTSGEKLLTVEEICASLKNRGGFTGDYGQVVTNAKQFFDEAAYLLCDGYGLNMGYFSIHTRVGGGWKTVDEANDRIKHPVGFSFRVRRPLAELADRIELDAQGITSNEGFIGEALDEATGSLDETATIGNILTITGSGLKVAGDGDCGVYFQSEDDQSLTRLVLAVNEPKTLKVVVPALPAGNEYRIVVKTCTPTGKHGGQLKTMRTIISDFTLSITQ